jgi:superfamily II DNA or RNA helicase
MAGMSLVRGLYEALLTELDAERLGTLGPSLIADVVGLRDAEAADRIALHLASVVERAIEALPEGTRAEVGVGIARRLVQQLARETEAPELHPQQPAEPGRLLRAIMRPRPTGDPERIESPFVPLLDTTLLTNSPGEPRVGHQIRTEIESADRIDLVMAFIRRSGILPLRDQLRRHVEAGRSLRVLTTAYTGSTEPEALDLLRGIGASVRVSYDTSSTRLHAKAWLFHRESGYSTAYVGSSNLTHSAQVTGLEWNVRVSAARNRAVVEKIAAVFDSYWEQPDFEIYDPARFAEATAPQRSSMIVLSPIEIRLEPFQERLLEQIELARERQHHRNLLVSATGTGKTVMAAVDYARLRQRLPRARLLFVAHRREILEQSRATFAHALRDGSFGELWVGGRRPQNFDHVFASIQSLSASNLDSLKAEHFDVVIVDEFHHAAAASYKRLLDHIRPIELIGLTATPERSDGQSVLQWFDGRIAAELRLWDAIDQHRLVPFAYYGIADDLDLRDVPWRRGRGYDVDGLTQLITANDVWARRVLKEFGEHVGQPEIARALGFCVSVDHARYMARVFSHHGVAATAIWADTPDDERRSALEDLAAGRINIVFAVDLFNEGIDVPAVDALLLLRPTDSPVLFLQQLGRGLRRSPAKTVCTVLDFVGQHRSEFRYDRQFRALLGGTRADALRAVESGFPFLPAGCHMELDRVATERVLKSIRQAVPNRWAEKANELRDIASADRSISLGAFLAVSGLELEDVYAGDHSWSDLREAAGLVLEDAGEHERALRRACGRLHHVDDAQRLDLWRSWLRNAQAPDPGELSERDRRLLRMLVAQLVDQIADKRASLEDGARILWQHPNVRRELVELFDVLSECIQHVAKPLVTMPDTPLQAHARYTRLEILAAAGVGTGAVVTSWQSGVLYHEPARVDLLAFTLDKTRGQFSPSTRYRDYAISRELIHWESQSVTRADSETGRRYQLHEVLGSEVFLFCRHHSGERSFYFLGPASFVRHEGERPMAITWRLQHPLPGDLFQAFAAAVA